MKAQFNIMENDRILHTFDNERDAVVKLTMMHAETDGVTAVSRQYVAPEEGRNFDPWQSANVDFWFDAGKQHYYIQPVGIEYIAYGQPYRDYIRIDRINSRFVYDAEGGRWSRSGADGKTVKSRSGMIGFIVATDRRRKDQKFYFGEM